MTGNVKTERQRIGSLARRKGATWEREVAKLIHTHSGRPAARNFEEARTGLASDIIVDLPLAIQCKVGGAPPIYDAVEEASCVAARRAHFAAAIIRRNEGPRGPKKDLVVMPLAHWLEWLQMLVQAEKL